MDNLFCSRLGEYCEKHKDYRMGGHGNKSREGDIDWNDASLEVRSGGMGGGKDDCGLSDYNVTDGNSRSMILSCISQNVSSLINAITNFEQMKDMENETYLALISSELVGRFLALSECSRRKKRSLGDDMPVDDCDPAFQDRFARCMFYSLRRKRHDINDIIMDDERFKNMSERQKRVSRPTLFNLIP